jgi:hypothetical protein
LLVAEFPFDDPLEPHAARIETALATSRDERAPRDLSFSMMGILVVAFVRVVANWRC